MKLLHVSDWHIGKVNGQESRVRDHEVVLGEIVQIARDLKSDLIMHTGDLFNQPRPSDNDMLMAVQILKELEQICPVVVVRGNHDSDRLFGVFRRLYDGGRLHFVDRPRAPNDGGILEFKAASDSSRVRLATLPFVHANRVVRDAFMPPADVMTAYADKIAWYQDIYAQALKEGADRATDVLLFGAHIFVAGAKLGKGEYQPHVTDTYAIRAEHIPQGISYAAFGHIHKPQRLAGATLAYYAGSPIPIDFGEEGEQKSVVFVEAKPGEPASAKTIPLSGGRQLVTVNETIEAIEARAEAIGNAIVHVVVKSEKPIDGLAERVRDILPLATILDVRADCEGTKARSLSIEDMPEIVEASTEDTFRDYLSKFGTKGITVDRAMEIFHDLHASVEEQSPTQFSAISNLEALLEGETNETLTA